VKNAYITKREAPEGYVVVTRILAEAIFERGFGVTVCGSKVNQFNIFRGENHGLTLRKIQTPEAVFDTLVDTFIEAMPKSLGRNCVFYVRHTHAEKVFQEVTVSPELLKGYQRRQYARRD
jgi:hypothetical protein